MSLVVGTRLGSYEIVDMLGAGGMGEVYRARDTTLGREVAIKVLFPALTLDPQRLARFEREARVLAALNHPNVGAIYGVERLASPTNAGPGPWALVLELVEGETLAAKLTRAPSGLPLPEVLPIARQIVAALDAAHEKGIVHRDLKPANIKVTPDGFVKVLDFGIAKVASGDEESSAEGRTVTSAATRAGQVIGTPAYMSPEQALGRPVDKRTDIWAFGCLLHEMLTGRPAFPGETVADTIAATLAREPDWSLLPASAPPRIHLLIRRCLAKDPKDRLRDIGDARAELDGQLSEETVTPAPLARFQWTTTRAGGALVAGLLLLVASAIAGRLTAPRPSATRASLPVQFWVAPPQAAEFLRGPDVTFFAISPDGAELAFVVQEQSGVSRIWLRPLSVLSPQPLAGTETATSAFWSPNGRSLGFFAGGNLKRFDLARNGVVTICQTPKGAGFSGTWGADDRILFATVSAEVIYSVAAGGGTPKAEITQTADRGVKFPWFLPDGRRFIYLSGRAGADRTVMLAEPNQTPRALLTVASNAQWVEPDAVVFARADGTLVAQRVDLARGQVIGQPFAIAPSVDYALGPGRAMFAVSPNGTVVYQPQQSQRLILVDRTGEELGELGPPGDYLNIRFSPDGQRLLFDRMQMGSGTYDIWIADLTRRVEDKVTSDPGNELGAVWFDGGRAVSFSSGPKASHLMSKDLGTGEVRRLLEGGDFKVPMDLSPDGGSLIFAERSDSGWGMWTLGLTGERRRAPLYESPFNQRSAQFSPNGRFIAFSSDESGHAEVYVGPFPGGRKQRVSPDGGSLPRWNRYGRELYYLASDGRLVSVPTLTTGELTVGTPTTLFRTGGVAKWVTFDVFPDGKRFAAVVPPAGAAIAVVQHFMPEAER